MAENQNLPHLKFDSYFEPKTYKYPKKLIIDFPQVQRDRAIHGNALLEQLNNIRARFEIAQEEPLDANIVKDEAMYVEFISEFNFPLKFESLTQESDNPQYQILNIKEEKLNSESDAPTRFRVVVMMKQGGISAFIKKVTQYLNETIKDREGNLTDIPKNSPLLNNIASIQLATLESFWSDKPEIQFPNSGETVWWEVWFRRTNNDGVRLENVYHNLREIGADISPQTLEFPEHRVRLVRATALQLSSSLFLLDNLAELRKPQQINDFITSRNVDFREKQEWLQDLIQRTDVDITNDSVVICLLDSGVNNQHPLITSFLPDERLYTYKTA